MRSLAGVSDYGRYRDLFCPRVDDYVYFDGRTETWRRARKPLTDAVLQAGLAGRPSISGYMVRPDGQTQVLALDVDVDGTGLSLARTTALAMRDHGVPALIEASRNGRAHLWVTLDDRVLAAAGRRFLTRALSVAGIDPDDKRIERFPAGDRAPGPGQVGRALRLPLIPNPKDRTSYPLLDPQTMVPLGDSLAAVLAAVEAAPASRVLELAGPEPEAEPSRRSSAPKHILAFNNTYSVSRVLSELWDVPNAAPGLSVRCPAHDDLHPSLAIFSDDRRVLCFAPACELHNDGRGRDAWDLMVVAPELDTGSRPRP